MLLLRTFAVSMNTESDPRNQKTDPRNQKAILGRIVYFVVTNLYLGEMKCPLSSLRAENKTGT